MTPPSSKKSFQNNEFLGRYKVSSLKAMGVYLAREFHAIELQLMCADFLFLIDQCCSLPSTDIKTFERDLAARR